MRWLGRYMIWIMAWIGFINAVDSWSIPYWAKLIFYFLGLLSWCFWDIYDKPSEEDVK